LARCLNLCLNLKELYLNSVGMSDKAMFSTLAKGAMAQLTYLSLNSNSIGDQGMNSFSTVLASGAMAKVTTLNLSGNKIGDGGMNAFSTALASGAMAKLKVLDIRGNPGDLCHCERSVQGTLYSSLATQQLR
jgi:hypothetical protein